MPKVFLSAGHGGKDSGAVAFGLKEKDINLQVLLGCKAELERHGIEVVTDRTTDKDMTLKEVVAMANASGAEIAMQFHVNAFKVNVADGCEFYIWDTNQEDRKLAELCVKYMKEIGQNSRGIKSGNHLYFCHYTNMTSCLAESFFIDNDKDNDIGDTIEEQKKIGVQYAKAILEYLGVKWIAPKNENEENAEIVDLLFSAGTLTDKALWLLKMKTDKNCYWLMRKMADYIKGGK